MPFRFSHPPVRLRLFSVTLGIVLSFAAAHAQIPVVDSADLESQGAAAKNYARMRQIENASVAAHRPWVWYAEKGTVKLWFAGCLHMGADPDPYAFPAYLPYYQRASV